MPELALFYFLGLLACLCLTGIFLFLLKRRQADRRFATLRANLAKAGLYWSESADAIFHYGESASASAADADALDLKASMKTAGFTGLLMSLMSWAGFLFLLLIMISYRFLARSRLERSLFSSPLASDPGLGEETVRTLVQAIAPVVQSRK